MSDVADAGQGAPAAGPQDVPVDAGKTSGTLPLGSQTPTPPKEPAPPAEKPSVREALQRATERSREATEAKSQTDAKAQPAAKPDAKTTQAPAKDAPKAEADGQPRGEGGKFAPRQASEPTADTQSDAPARFSAEGKQAWKDAPEPVRRETQRALEELTKGHEKYRSFAEAYEPLRELDEAAKREGTSLKAAMDQYTALSRGLQSQSMPDKLAALRDVFDHAGLDMRAFAAQVLGQKQDERATQDEGEKRALRQEIAELRRQVGSVTGHIQSREVATMEEQISAFASKPEHSRFEELTPAIAKLIRSGMTTDLAEAYQMADRLNPAPSPPRPPAPAPAAAPDPAPLTPAGGKSIAGSPFAGSPPPNARPAKPPSVQEALRRAFSAAS